MKWSLVFTCLLFLNVEADAQKQFSIIKSSADRKMIPEGIAVDSRSSTIYLSSIAQHKIVKVNKRGVATDFIVKAEQPFLEGLGMKIDKANNRLWAVSNL